MSKYPNAYDDPDSLPTVTPGGCGGGGGGGVGPTGPVGPIGPTGPVGPPGPQGGPGPQGIPGTNGTNGTNGAPGATGATGPAGTPGGTGATGPAGPVGPQGGQVFIYRPGGVAVNNVYTSWSLLMAARNGVVGLATIVIDDSITSPAVIPSGTWTLTKNTIIMGYSGNSSTLTTMQLVEGCQLTNPYEFHNIRILGAATATPNIILSSPYTSIDVRAENSIFKTLNSATATIFQAPQLNLVLDGYSRIETSTGFAPFQNIAGSQFNFYLNDNSIVQNDVLNITGIAVNAYINSPIAYFNTTQGALIGSLNIFGANLIGNLASVPDGYVLSKNGLGTSSWIPMSGGTTIPTGPANTVYSSNGTSNSFSQIVDGYIASNANIAYTKLATITTDSLLGRDTAGTGTLETISVGGGIEFTGASAIRRGAISGDVTIAAGATTATVTDLTITGEVQGSILYFNGTNWVRLAPGTDGYALTTHSTGNNPTWEMLNGGATPTGPAGGDLSGSYPNPTVVDLTISGEAQGDILYRNATNWVRLAAGTDGYVLTTHSTGNNPTWSATGSSIPTGAAGGDLSGTYPNPQIATGVIVNADINASAAIAFSKLATITTDSLLGRDTAGTGALETITLDTTLAMSGAQVLGRSAISGDITIAANSNTSAITAGVIVNADVNASAAIALSKLATITTDRILGRDTAGTGAIEELTVSGGIEFTGATGLQRSALTGDVTAAAGSNTTTITTGVITDTHINSSAAIAVTKLANGTALSVLGRGTNTNGSYADIVAGTDGYFLGRSGTSINFIPVTVSDNSITLPKLVDITTDSLLGRDTAGTGDVEVITLNSTLEMTGTQVLQRAALTGDITASAGSNTTAIAAGVIVDADVNASAAIAHTKLATIATDSLLGRDTAGTGTLETISLNATLSMTGAGALQRSALTGDVTAAAGSNTTAIAAGVIVDADVNASAAIALSKLATQAALSVVANGTNATAVPTAIVASTDGYVLARSGTTLAFVPNNPTISDGSITMAKLADLAGLSLIGRSTNTTGVPAAITATVTGQIPIYNGTTLSFGSPNFGALNIVSTGSLTINGITNSGAYAGGTNPASAGIIRLPNATNIRFRNAANSADIDGLAVDSSNLLILGNSADTAITLDDSTDTITLKSANTNRLVINTTTVNAQNLNITTTGSLAGSFATLGNNAASAGILRLPNANNIRFRNAANSADLDALGCDASNNIFLGNTSDTAITLNDSTDTINMRTGGNIQLAIDNNSIDCQDNFITTSNYIRLGTNPAASGQIRIPNATAIAARNAANSGDFNLISSNSSNEVIVGTSSDTSIVLTDASNLITIKTGNATQLTINDTTIDAQDNTIITTGNLYLGANPAASGNFRVPNTFSMKADGYAVAGDIGLIDVNQDIITIGDGYVMMEAIELAYGRRIVSLARTSAITSTQMGPNTGDGVIFINKASTPPFANPKEGIILYSNSFSAARAGLAARATLGTVSSLVPARGATGAYDPPDNTITWYKYSTDGYKTTGDNSTIDICVLYPGVATCAIFAKATLVVQKQDGSAGMLELARALKVTGGTCATAGSLVTIVGSSGTPVGDTFTGASATITTDGSSIYVNITGITSVNIQWYCVLEVTRTPVAG